MDLIFMRLKKIVASPKSSLLLICVCSSVYVLERNYKTMIMLIVSCIITCLLSVLRYKKDFIEFLHFVSEVVGIIAFGLLYLIYYSKTIFDNEINVLFIIGSIIFLVPIIIEVSLD